MSVEKDLKIKARATFKMEIKLRDKHGQVVELDGYSGKAEIKADYKDELPLAVFSVVIDEEEDKLTMTLPPAESDKLMQIKTGKTGVWDLFITSPTDFTSRVLYGKVEVERAATSL